MPAWAAGDAQPTWRTEEIGQADELAAAAFNRWAAKRSGATATADHGFGV